MQSNFSEVLQQQCDKEREKWYSKRLNDLLHIVDGTTHLHTHNGSNGLIGASPSFRDSLTASGSSTSATIPEMVAGSPFKASPSLPRTLSRPGSSSLFNDIPENSKLRGLRLAHASYERENQISELMQEIEMEVLIEQPSDVLDFIANFCLKRKSSGKIQTGATTKTKTRRQLASRSFDEVSKEIEAVTAAARAAITKNSSPSVPVSISRQNIGGSITDDKNRAPFQPLKKTDDRGGSAPFSTEKSNSDFFLVNESTRKGKVPGLLPVSETVPQLKNNENIENISTHSISPVRSPICPATPAMKSNRSTSSTDSDSSDFGLFGPRSAATTAVLSKKVVDSTPEKSSDGWGGGGALDKKKVVNKNSASADVVNVRPSIPAANSFTGQNLSTEGKESSSSAAQSQIPPPAPSGSGKNPWDSDGGDSQPAPPAISKGNRGWGADDEDELSPPPAPGGNRRPNMQMWDAGSRDPVKPHQSKEELAGSSEYLDGKKVEEAAPQPELMAPRGRRKDPWGDETVSEEAAPQPELMAPRGHRKDPWGDEAVSEEVEIPISLSVPRRRRGIGENPPPVQSVALTTEVVQEEQSVPLSLPAGRRRGMAVDWG